MSKTAIALRRLSQQRLSQGSLATPAEAVGWLGAVQAQEYAGARWALGLRMQAASDGLIAEAFDAGSILRTHVMRPTWHFVTPDDIRWLLELTAPRVNLASAGMYRRLELDDDVFGRSNAAMAEALRGARYLTRAELGAALAEAGIVAEGVRLLYIFMRAELDGLLCSGPLRGKQLTYALLAERAPQARLLPRDEALAELTRRYFTGHGPATIRDFAWWSGLTMAAAQEGLAMAAPHLEHEVIDGQTYWSSASVLPADDQPGSSAPYPPAFLLPTYDEFLIGYAAFDASRRQGAQNLTFASVIVMDGKVIGTWRRAFSRGGVDVELAPFAPLTAVAQTAVMAAVERYGRFLGMPARGALTPPS